MTLYSASVFQVNDVLPAVRYKSLSQFAFIVTEIQRILSISFCHSPKKGNLYKILTICVSLLRVISEGWKENYALNFGDLNKGNYILGFLRLKCFWNTPLIFNLFLSFRAYCHYFAIFFKVIDVLLDDMETIVYPKMSMFKLYHVFIIQSDITMLDS